MTLDGGPQSAIRLLFVCAISFIDASQPTKALPSTLGPSDTRHLTVTMMMVQVGVSLL